MWTLFALAFDLALAQPAASMDRSSSPPRVSAPPARTSQSPDSQAPLPATSTSPSPRHQWFASPMQFFDGTPHRAGGSRGRTPGQDPLDWTPYLDPQHTEYWRRPDGTLPPAPLLELARDPTPANQARVRTWMQGQLQSASALSELLAAAWEPEGTDPTSTVSWNAVEIDFIYASRCGYCARAVPLMKELEARGATLRPLFLDAPLPAFASHPRSGPWAPVASASGVAVTATPTFVVRSGGASLVVEGLLDEAGFERVRAELRSGP